MSTNDEGQALAPEGPARAGLDITTAATTESDSHSSGGGHAIYGVDAAAWQASGLGSPLPLPPGRKAPVPTGWTGHGAPYTSGADVAEFAAAQPRADIALRLAPTLIGIDVDAYGDKAGDLTMTDLVERLGVLPPTLVVTSRGYASSGNPSGVRVYRIPEGSTEGLPAALGPGVDVVRPEHRYIKVCGTHPEGGTYRLYDSHTGQPLAGPPPGRDLHTYAFDAQQVRLRLAGVGRYPPTLPLPDRSP